MEVEKQLDEHESLLIIQQMIDTAKKEQKDDGWGWIVWGWAIFAASVLTIFNMRMNWFSTFFFWNVFGLLTIVLMCYEMIRDFMIKKHERVKTYTKAIFQKLNIGFFICLMFIIASMNMGVGPMKGFALLLALYGFWILIYAALLDFKPSLIGAFVTWGFGIASLLAPSFEWVMIFHAGAVLCGYIIPGHIANIKFKQVAERSTNRTSSV